ncbi:hypothetical protein CBL_14478 [Carabus blaptoides fortunei]
MAYIGIVQKQLDLEFNDAKSSLDLKKLTNYIVCTISLRNDTCYLGESIREPIVFNGKKSCDHPLPLVTTARCHSPSLNVCARDVTVDWLEGTSEARQEECHSVAQLFTNYNTFRQHGSRSVYTQHRHKTFHRITKTKKLKASFVRVNEIRT